MRWYVVRLRFTAPLRIGHAQSGIGVEAVQPFLHADTLFSAFCNTWARYGLLSFEELSRLDSVFNQGEPPFRFSSAFPFVQSNYYFPRPQVPSKQFSQFGESMTPARRENWRKRLKNAFFVHHTHLRDWLGEKQFVKLGWTSVLEDWQRYVHEVVQPHHEQDRLSAASQLFHVGQLYFADADCGLFFLVRFPDTDAEDRWRELLDMALRGLSRDGIGGKRRRMGQFRCEGAYGRLLPVTDPHPLTEVVNREGTQHCLISLFHPGLESEAGDQDRVFYESPAEIEMAYHLVPRRGWSFSTSVLHQKKRQGVWMFGEGSTFEMETPPRGKLLNVQPSSDFPHPVWRYGIALSVPLS